MPTKRVRALIVSRFVYLYLFCKKPKSPLAVLSGGVDIILMLSWGANVNSSSYLYETGVMSMKKPYSWLSVSACGTETSLISYRSAHQYLGGNRELWSDLDESFKQSEGQGHLAQTLWGQLGARTTQCCHVFFKIESAGKYLPTFPSIQARLPLGHRQNNDRVELLLDLFQISEMLEHVKSWGAQLHLGFYALHEYRDFFI